MKATTIERTNGYYRTRIFSLRRTRLFYSNNERAFVIMQLQQLLAARSILEEPSGAHSLAHHIDLLAFSVSEKGIELLTYAIAETSLRQLVTLLSDRLSQYQSEYPRSHVLPAEPIISTQKLHGEHEALRISVEIHQLHSDWEYDRYSSIGFYLHDRRGDWMKVWRLANLFNNEPELYRTLLIQHKAPALDTPKKYKLAF